METIRIRTPFDAHVHFRDGGQLAFAAPYTADQWDKAVIMPNLTPPVKTAADAFLYRERILDAVGNCENGANFTPLMTIYLTDLTTESDVRDAVACGFVVAAKLYPANATTNSSEGVTNIRALYHVFSAMEREGLVLCVHGETLRSNVFGDSTRGGKVGQLRREAVFLKESLSWLVDTFPRLRIVLEHISTIEAINFVESCRDGVVATITAHHLLATLDDVFISHHNRCMPTLKEEPHRQALLRIATSGNNRFFAGTDSAPHPTSAKETHCGCAGCFTGLHGVELYAVAFDEANALHRLEGFLSLFGPKFYGLQPASSHINITRTDWSAPSFLLYQASNGDRDKLTPFWAGQTLSFKACREQGAKAFKSQSILK